MTRGTGSTGGARPPPGAPNRAPNRALARLARLPARPLRLRLIDAVTLAAAGLLVLKLAALVADAPSPGPPAPGTPLPDFARVLAKPRTGYEPPDPTTTGSVTPKEKSPQDKEAKSADPASYQPAAPEIVSPTERAILEKLAARRDTLKARSDALDLRERVLNDAERKLEDGVADLRQAEDKADVGGTKKAEAEKGGLRNIVTMYETMKPKDAARVFDRLSLDVLVPLVLAMNPRKMAEVLAVMGPEPAERLTVALANRARGVEASAAPAGPGLPPNELPAIDPVPPAKPAAR